MWLMITSLKDGSRYLEATALYVMSFVGDLFDGMAARKVRRAGGVGETSDRDVKK